MKYNVHLMVEGDVVQTTVTSQGLDTIEEDLKEDFQEFEILSIEKGTEDEAV